MSERRHEAGSELPTGRRRGSGADPLLAIGSHAADREGGRLLGDAPDRLPSDVRGMLQATFGRDVGDVAVHAGNDAARLSRALRARAFATGSDIFFDSGRYRPDTNAGRRLIAHEVAHVVQQDFGRQGAPGLLHGVSPESPALEADADRSAAAALGPGARAPALKARPGIQRQPTDTAPPAPDAATPATSTGPPVIFGLDTSAAPARVYASVTVPGHSLADIATYLYGSPDLAPQLASANGGVPDQVPPGRSLRLIEGTVMSAAANRAVDAGLDNGTIMRTSGLPTQGEAITVYRVSLPGGEMQLTDVQYVGMLNGAAVWITRRARYYRDMLEILLDTRNSHVEDTNSVVRGISDWAGDVDLPSPWLFSMPMRRAEWIAETMSGLHVTVDSAGQIAAGLEALRSVASSLDRADSAWHSYIQGTIAGAEATAHGAEIVRNVSFGVVAGLAGAIAAPAVFAAAGVGLAGAGVTGATATVISGTAAVGAGAVAGGTLRGGLEVLAPGANADQPVSARFVHGFESGAVQGGLGAAGALAAPGVANVIAGRLFGVPAIGLTTTASRLTVNALTGTAIGVPSGSAAAGIEGLPAFMSGKTSGSEYARSIGVGGLTGGAGGALFSLLPVQGLYRAGGQRFNPFSGEAYTPNWMLAGPWSPRIQELPNAPAAFHALPNMPDAPLPPGYYWVRHNGRWVTMRPYNVPEEPLSFFSWGPDPAGRFNYHVVSNGRLLGSRTTPRSPTDLYRGPRRIPGLTTDDFAEPGGPRYDRGHLTDQADTLEGPGLAPSSEDPVNFLPEPGWWNRWIRNPLVNDRIRPAGNGYREMAYYDLATPRFTANGTPIPEGVFFAEVTPAGQVVNAWRIPYNHPSSPRGLAALAQFVINPAQLPPIMLGSAPSPVVGVGGAAASEATRRR